MPIELKVPSIGESISEVEIGDWLVGLGSRVEKDAPVVTLESDKATVELPAPTSGVLAEMRKKKGETAQVGEVIGSIDDTPAPASSVRASEPARPETPAAPPPRVMPAAQRALTQENLKASEVKATGPGGRVLKEDVQRYKEEIKAEPPAKETPPAALPAPALPSSGTSPGNREDEIVPMTKLRRTLAARLVEAQNTAAMLTTFNEVDMSTIIGLRKEFGDAFQQKYQTKLGFMSFFVKASVDALQAIPTINAEVRGNDIVYHRYYDIAVAIGGGKGLVVPVLRNAERLSFAEIELRIMDLAQRARENKLKPDDLQGGTFTISNGGIYGSVLSTPILNPPQSGLLGMHAIQDRPVARDGQVVVRPMMNLALTYDHRIVDGREAVTFLKRVKEVIEAPARILMGI